MSVEDMIETLADSVCKIADALSSKYTNFNYDEICMLNNVYYDANYIKEELEKSKE